MPAVPPKAARPPQAEPHQHRQVAESFGEDAGRYDRTRPPYPGALVDRIVAASPGRDVLATVLESVGAAIDAMGGSFTMPYTTVAVTAARITAA